MARGEAGIAAKKSTKTAEARFRAFETFCATHGYLGVSYASVTSFLADFMGKNQDHTASLSGVLSNLRTQHSRRELAFLSPHDDDRVKRLLEEWKKQDASAVQRKDPLRFPLLQQIIGRMDLTKVSQLQQATQLLLATQAVLRTKEITSGLRGADVVWKPDRVVAIHLAPTKTCKDGRGVWIEVADSTHELSAYKLLKRLCEARNLQHRPGDFVFCQIRQGVLSPEVKSSERAWRKLIKTSVAAIGLDPARYSGHSARAGGATDLFAAGLPYYVIKKYGRWKSDAALIYYRCETSIARCAATAFS